ncbi:large-conductance mechanosensitive channel protein MscL [Patescibacteria group bacterium]|nr:large-conductance mechanosensitive channel protein MscL [Patescibacteria group bacterium]
MSIIQEFREFAIRGNVVDLAVGILIGGAFGKIVNSLVNDVVMPPISLLLQGVNVRDLRLVLRTNAEGEALSSIGYGQFLQNALEFFVIAMAVFVFVKAMNRLRRRFEGQKEQEAAKLPSEEVLLLREIRDALKRK